MHPTRIYAGKHGPTGDIPEGASLLRIAKPHIYATFTPNSLHMYSTFTPHLPYHRPGTRSAKDVDRQQSTDWMTIRNPVPRIESELLALSKSLAVWRSGPIRSTSTTEYSAEYGSMLSLSPQSAVYGVGWLTPLELSNSRTLELSYACLLR